MHLHIHVERKIAWITGERTDLLGEGVTDRFIRDAHTQRAFNCWASIRKQFKLSHGETFRRISTYRAENHLPNKLVSHLFLSLFSLATCAGTLDKNITEYTYKIHPLRFTEKTEIPSPSGPLISAAVPFALANSWSSQLALQLRSPLELEKRIGAVSSSIFFSSQREKEARNKLTGEKGVLS